MITKLVYILTTFDLKWEWADERFPDAHHNEVFVEIGLKTHQIDLSKYDERSLLEYLQKILFEDVKRAKAEVQKWTDYLTEAEAKYARTNDLSFDLATIKYIANSCKKLNITAFLNEEEQILYYGDAKHCFRRSTIDDSVIELSLIKDIFADHKVKIVVTSEIFPAE